MTDAMAESLLNYANSKGFRVLPRTVFVEGTSDVEIFHLAAQLEYEATGFHLLDGDLAIVSAGEGDEGGVRGVCRQLLVFSEFSSKILLPDGRKKYRFIALMDNDDAGRSTTKTIKNIHPRLVEFQDVFLLRPVMPLTSTLDPQGLQRTFERENAAFRTLDWEIEDYLPKEFFDAFLDDRSNGIRSHVEQGGKVHREFAIHSKGEFHKFVRKHAMRSDLAEVIKVLLALRTYLRLPIHKSNSCASE